MVTEREEVIYMFFKNKYKELYEKTKLMLDDTLKNYQEAMDIVKNYEKMCSEISETQTKTIELITNLRKQNNDLILEVAMLRSERK